MLNTMQRYMLDATLDYALQRIQRRLAPQEALIALKAITDDAIFKTYQAAFAETGILGYIQQLRALLQHSSPQNRSRSLIAPDVLQEQGVAFWKDPKTGQLNKEPLGLLGLTTQNEESTPPVTAGDVKDYVQFKIKSLQQALEGLAVQPPAPALFPEVEQLIWQQAEMLIKSRKEREALPLLKQLTSSCVGNAEYFYQYGRSLAVTAQRKEALAAFNQAAQLRPEHAQTFVERGLTLENVGDLAGALRDYSHALRLAPEHAFALCQRAGIYFSLKQITKAEQDYQASLAYKADPNTYCQRGERFLALGRYEQALADFKEALALRPDWPRAKALQQEAQRQKMLMPQPGAKNTPAALTAVTLSRNDVVMGFTQADFLGEGSYGSVWRGSWQNKTVAVKRLANQGFTEIALKELQDEVKIMKELDHPNVIKLYGVCEEEEERCLLLEFAAQGSLYKKLNTINPPAWSERWEIAMDAGRGLQYLHNKKILHRDLKSANVVLDAKGVAKLCDFGMATVKLETQSQIKATLIPEEQAPAGTVRYMAPECFDGQYSKASDVYSFGTLLWELAACKVPFKHFANVFAIIAYVKDNKREEIPANTPPTIAKLIKWCWEQDPAKRPKIEEVVSALEKNKGEADMACSKINAL